MRANMKAFRKLASFSAGVALAAFLASCSNSEPESPPLLLPENREAFEAEVKTETGFDVEDVSGRWRPAPEGARLEPTPEQQAEIDRLESIGYLSGSKAAPSVVNITKFDSDRAYPGYNFFTSGHAPEAVLMDMEGAVLHRWSYDFETLWPNRRISREARGTEHWRRAYLYPNGDILAIHEGIGMIKLDRFSNLIWDFPDSAHHDMHVMENGDIYTLTRRGEILSHINTEQPILHDYVSVLDENGVEKRKVSLLRAFETSEFRSMLDDMRDWGDVFHTNSVYVLDGALADKHPAFKKGNVLISILKLHIVAVVDLDREQIVWAMKGGYRFQHDPRMLENGNILVFDNRGRGTQSAVYEIDPLTQKTVWAYEGDRRQPFFSLTCGAAYRLPNGNTLIVESDNGRAFELTKDKEIVWEFYNPHRAGPNNEFIATLFDVQRIEKDHVSSWLTR